MSYHANAAKPRCPLGAPALVAAGTGQFEVLAHQRDHPTTPVAFDPCRPIHYVVNVDGAPSDGLKLLQDAVARVGTATSGVSHYWARNPASRTSDQSGVERVGAEDVPHYSRSGFVMS
jgi:hypothetical protein